MNSPKPGSREATENGCECPIMDNHFGKGRPVKHKSSEDERHWIISENCPLHSNTKNHAEIE